MLYQKLLCGILLLVVGWVLPAESVRAQAATALSATLDYQRLRTEDGKALLQLALAFPVESLGMYAAAASAGWEARVDVHLFLTDTAGAYAYADHFTLHSPVLDSATLRTSQLQEFRRVALEPGPYTLSLRVRDLYGSAGDTLRAEFPVDLTFPADSMFFSDLRFDHLQPMADSTFRRQPYANEFFPSTQNHLLPYLELYDSHLALGDSTPFLVTFKVLDAQHRIQDKVGRMVRLRAAPLIRLSEELDIRALPSGNYFLLVEAFDRERRRLTYQRKYFQRSNRAVQPELASASGGLRNSFVGTLTDAELEHLVPALQPLAQESERNTLNLLIENNDSEQYRAYLYEFWTRRSPTPEQQLNAFRERLVIAESLYATRRLRAHETDRGRVYLQHGKPNRIENERTFQDRSAMDRSQVIPFEIWYYPYLEHRNQRDRVFVFAQEERANDNYRLIHSDAIGEFSNVDWKRNIYDGAQNLDRRNAHRTDDALIRDR